MARSRQSTKRGGEARQIALAEEMVASPEGGTDFVALDMALETLAKFDHRKSQIVVLRFFGGLNIEETAAVLQVSPRTVKRDWSVARAWLHAELSQDSL